MTTHLDDNDLSRAMAQLPLEAAAADHLAQCLICRRRVEAFGEQLDGLRRARLGDEPDWEAQRLAVLERLPPGATVVALAPRRRVRLLAAAALILAALGLGALQLSRRQPQPTAPVPVERILAEVNATLDGPVYPGFEALEPIVPDADELQAVINNPTS
jgi:hypothetical protein